MAGAVKMDYDGNEFDSAGNYLGTDYPDSQHFVDAAAAHTNLIDAQTAAGAVHDAVAAGTLAASDPTVHAADTALTNASQGFTAVTSARTPQAAAQALQNQTDATIAAHNAALTATTPAGTGTTTTTTPGSDSSLLGYALLIYSAWSLLRDLTR